MRDLSPGWATDLAILELSGSLIEDRGDHLVVRSPHTPAYHWGNSILVTDPSGVDDASRWLAAFAVAHPEARWIAIGLPRMPADVTAWQDLGVSVDLDEVLTTPTPPVGTPTPEGYFVRQIVSGDDWAQIVARGVAENAAADQHDPVSHRAFLEGQSRVRRDLSERGVAAYFGAFSADTLVAELGIVVCDRLARYQAVGTEGAHRRRGLAAHLLGVAAQWSAVCGCTRWVIVTEATNNAGRIYRRAGFAPDSATVTVYRAPPR